MARLFLFENIFIKIIGYIYCNTNILKIKFILIKYLFKNKKDLCRSKIKKNHKRNRGIPFHSNSLT